MPLMHYIFLGEPNAQILERALNLLRRQTDPALNRYNRPKGIFWTLNAETQNSAERILHDLSDKSVDLEIYDATFVLLSKLKKTSILLSPEESLCLELTKKIGAYLLTLQAERQNVTTCEFVTAKDFLALWVAYIYGGVIFDAGCRTDRPSWGLESLDPNIFYMPITSTTILASMILVDKRSLIGSGFNYKIYPDSLLPYLYGLVDFPKAEPRNTTKFIISLIDNWMIYSPIYSKVALFTLKNYLLHIPFLYQMLEKNNRSDQVAENGYGFFALMSAGIGLSASYNGYYENSVQHPEDIQNNIIVRTPGALDFPKSRFIKLNFRNVGIVTTFVSSESDVHSSIGITKHITQPDRLDDVIQSGWRRRLTDPEVVEVLRRYHIFNRQWNST